MNYKTLIFFLLVFPAAAGRPIWAVPAAGLPTIEISATRTGITLGDSLAVRCMVSVPAGVIAGVPYPAVENPFLELELRSDAEESSDGETVKRYDFLTYVFSPDSARVGPFVVHYVTAAGDSGTVTSNTLEFPVRGMLRSPDDSPKPNRAPFDIPGSGLPGWGYALLAALGAALLAAWLLAKRKKRPAPVPVIERPLDEIGEFEQIRALHLRETGQVKELYAMVSGAMRGFVHRNMGFDALYSTTWEIRRTLSRTWKDRETAEIICAILEESDMVKFARFAPPDELSATYIDRAIDPVRKVLEQIAADRERERMADEERRRAAVQTAAAPDSGFEAKGEGR